MRKLGRRALGTALLTLAAVLAVGIVSAQAHGRGGGASIDAALVTAAANELDVSAATLTKAITDAARARIDEAVDDGDVDAEDADELEERAEDSLRYAYSLSRTKVVATNLGKTTAQLNTAFRAARKAQVVARIDEALEDGDLEGDEAADLKADLATTKLAGYKPLNLGFGLGLGGGAFAGGRGCGGAGGGASAGPALSARR